MDNQYTPTYHRLWNREFSLLIAAESLLCIACYMTIPFLPYRLYTSHYIGSQWANLTMVMFVAGIFLSGFFVSWLIQRYRRNKVFFTSVLTLAGIILAMTMFDNPKRQLATQDDIISLMAACLVGGMAFGNAKRVLSCTLLIDKTESRHRTEANYAAIWIARMAIVLGPIASIMLRPEVDNMWFYGIGAVAALLAGIIVMSVKFPFRAPEEGTHFISIDRFFLPQGWNVAIVVALMSTALGV
ncbi:MFS transporter, partial [uncultured Prevotella sp.]|uniref:MFS transporter n=1 Tax=uncultured Prevotella sp. TaxID=159272 RepID=UPI0035B441F0